MFSGINKVASYLIAPLILAHSSGEEDINYSSSDRFKGRGGAFTNLLTLLVRNC